MVYSDYAQCSSVFVNRTSSASITIFVCSSILGPFFLAVFHNKKGLIHCTCSCSSLQTSARLLRSMCRLSQCSVQIRNSQHLSLDYGPMQVYCEMKQVRVRFSRSYTLSATCFLWSSFVEPYGSRVIMSDFLRNGFGSSTFLPILLHVIV